MNDVIEIPLSKVKIVLYFIGALIFVLLGILYTIDPLAFISFRHQNETLIRIAGIASVIFFGMCLVFISRKLLDKKVGLRIDKDGIHDNSNVHRIGLIEWSDVTGFKMLQIASVKMLVVMTNEPSKYIERANNGMAKRAMKSNFNHLGSPLTINSGSLKIKFDDLEKLLVDQLERNKRPTT